MQGHSMFFYYLHIHLLVSGTEVNWWWSRKGQRFSLRYNCALPGKVEDIGSCGKCGWSSFECSGEEAYACLQWKAGSFTSSTRVLLGKLRKKKLLSMKYLIHCILFTALLIFILFTSAWWWYFMFYDSQRASLVERMWKFDSMLLCLYCY